MRVLLVLQVIVLLSLTSSVTALAGPVTGQSVAAPAEESSSDDERRENDERERYAAVGGGGLFDAIGLPLLRLSAPIYLALGERPKVRALGSASSASSGIQEVFPASDIGNVAVQVGVNLTNGLVVPGPFGGIAPGVQQVPEPGALWLLAPAMLLALRRRLAIPLRRS